MKFFSGFFRIFKDEKYSFSENYEIKNNINLFILRS